MPAFETGLLFSNSIPAARHLTNQLLLDGSGVAIGDADGDGRPDVFFASAGGNSELWRNLGGWRFSNITTQAFPDRVTSTAGDVTAAVFADVTADSRADLILNTHADGIRILINEGAGVFRSSAFRQVSARGGHSLALADIDGDGWVDIYVCNYRQRALMDMPNARASFRRDRDRTVIAAIDGRPTTAPDLTNRFVLSSNGSIEELGEPDVIYKNSGGTNWTALAWTDGTFLDEEGRALSAPPFDWGLAAQFCDINSDGRPDIYVCNDFQTPDRLWLNESRPGVPRFRAAPGQTLRHTSLFSMGVDFADINRDGRWDFAVLDMLSPDHARRMTMLDGSPTVSVDAADPLTRPQSDANTLFLQRPDGTFAEIAQFAGLAATDWSWCPVFVDADLDGWPDLLITAGQERGSRDLDVAEHMKAFRKSGIRTDAQIFREREKFPRLLAPLRAYRNVGADTPGSLPRFEEAGWGFDFNGVSHGMALGDLDGDGDLDVVVSHLNAPAGLYRNEASGPRLAVRLTGRVPNTAAIGATLRFHWDSVREAAAAPVQLAQVIAGGRYLSGDDPAKAFACPGPGTGRLEILWPSGRITRTNGLVAGGTYVIPEPDDAGVPGAVALSRAVGRFRFESKVLANGGGVSASADFPAQPSIPRRASFRHPALAPLRDSNGAASLWIGRDTITPMRKIGNIANPVLQEMEAPRTTVALEGCRGGLIAADAFAEAGSGGASPVYEIDGTTGARKPVRTSATAPSCLAVSGDGSWLFVGGGSLPGRYPVASQSEVLKWTGTGWSAVFSSAMGIVTGGRFADFDSGGEVELVSVAEWGSPRFFHISGTNVTDWDPVVSLPDGTSVKSSELSGWWQSVAVADFDSDGREDLVLGNWGLNSAHMLYSGRPKIAAGPVRPLHLYYGPINEDGMISCMEAYTAGDGRLLPMRNLVELSRTFPWLTQRFPTHRAFAEASATDILSGRDASRTSCRWLTSLVLLNRGGRFEARALPDLAQTGPVTALAIADFDGDGRADIYGAQSFWENNFSVMRDDAGEGFFLAGRGDGNFSAATTAEAGFRILGEQQAALAADFDNDGRVDIAVSERGGQVTLLHNLK